MKRLVLAAALVLSGAGTAAGQSDAGVPSPSAGADAGADADAGANAGVIMPGPLPPGVEPPTAIAVPSSAKVQIGKRFSLFITVTHSKGMEVNLPASLQLGAAFEEVRRATTRSTNAAGLPVREFEVELIAWLVGDMRIPPLEVSYTFDGSVYKVYTKPVPIRVITMIGDGEEKLRDIVPPVSVMRKDHTILYILYAILLAIAAEIGRRLGRRWVRKRRKRVRHRKRRRAAAVSSTPLDPAEEALAKLAELEESDAIEAEDRDPVFVEVSAIVRRYLGRQFDFRSMDLTTAETKQRLADLPHSDQVIELLGDLLDRADLVKYADYGASADDARGAIEDARRLVEETRHMRAPEPEPVAPPHPHPQPWAHPQPHPQPHPHPQPQPWAQPHPHPHPHPQPWAHPHPQPHPHPRPQPHPQPHPQPQPWAHPPAHAYPPAPPHAYPHPPAPAAHPPAPAPAPAPPPAPAHPHPPAPAHPPTSWAPATLAKTPGAQIEFDTIPDRPLNEPEGAGSTLTGMPLARLGDTIPDHRPPQVGFDTIRDRRSPLEDAGSTLTGMAVAPGDIPPPDEEDPSTAEGAPCWGPTGGDDSPATESTQGEPTAESSPYQRPTGGGGRDGS